MTTASFTQIAGWTVVHFVWHGAAIAACAAVLLRLARRLSPNVRYLLACTGLAAMLAVSWS